MGTRSSMAVHIRIAASAEELDAIFCGRYEAYVDELAMRRPAPERRLVDRFDAFPLTANLLAELDGRVVGGIRLVPASGIGTPADTYFDFTPHLPDGCQHGSLSMHWIARALRGTSGLNSSLMAAFYELARARGLTHVVAPLNPEVWPGYERAGWRCVHEAFDHHSR